MSHFLRRYFDTLYNPVYDLTTARVARFGALQKMCVADLEPVSDHRVLVVGLGTGNELPLIHQRAPEAHVTGVDFSSSGLRKAREKARRLGVRLETAVMDVRKLAFPEGIFDSVLAIHLMDFVDGIEVATREILRVLKPGGRYVITYPAQLEGSELAVNLLRDSVRSGIRESGALFFLLQFLVQLTLGLVYLPLLFRSGRKQFTKQELNILIKQCAGGEPRFREDAVYGDFIVSGEKQRGDN